MLRRLIYCSVSYFTATYLGQAFELLIYRYRQVEKFGLLTIVRRYRVIRVLDDYEQ